MSDGTEGNLKVPSQIFRWFERMKSNYENSVQSVLSKFEEYNDKQQLRIDNGNKEHIESLKDAHNSQIAQNQKNISQLHDDVIYYKQQITQQQKTIEQLNSRYDAVMACLINEKTSNGAEFKNTFDSDDFFTSSKSELPKPTVDMIEKDEDINHSESDNPNQDPYYSEGFNSTLEQPLTEDKLNQLFTEAVALRSKGNSSDAFQLFKQLSSYHHAQSMGAVGRSYFLGEGVEENHKLGLLWLLKAAKLNLPQAINRVEHYKNNEPELYRLAKNLLETE